MGKKAFIENNNLRIFTVVKLKTTNNRNGNPRRCWVIINSTPQEMAPLHPMGGMIVCAIDEGNEGDAAVKRLVANLVKWHTILVIWGPEFTTTPFEYRKMLKEHGRKILAPGEGDIAAKLSRAGGNAL